MDRAEKGQGMEATGASQPRPLNRLWVLNCWASLLVLPILSLLAVLLVERLAARRGLPEPEPQ